MNLKESHVTILVKLVHLVVAFNNRTNSLNTYTIPGYFRKFVGFTYIFCEFLLHITGDRTVVNIILSDYIYKRFNL